MNVDHSMNIGRVLQGGLFTSDFLIDAVQEMVEWQRWDDGEVFGTELQNIFNAFPIDQNPNESQTEDDLIWPILNQLGWKAYLRQQNLTPRGRDDVPDGLLFDDDTHKARANDFAEEWRRYDWGLAIVESKRIGCPTLSFGYRLRNVAGFRNPVGSSASNMLLRQPMSEVLSRHFYLSLDLEIASQFSNRKRVIATNGCWLLILMQPFSTLSLARKSKVKI